MRVKRTDGAGCLADGGGMRAVGNSFDEKIRMDMPCDDQLSRQQQCRYDACYYSPTVAGAGDGLWLNKHDSNARTILEVG